MTAIVFSRDHAMLGESGYPRRIADHYPTPAWVTEAVVPYLLQHIAEDDPVWECACGSGEMAMVLKYHFTNVQCSDLYDYGYPAEIADFLASEPLPVRTAIVTNPPYFDDMPERFLRHALMITQASQGVVAMLLRNEYDSARSRVDLFNRPPFARKLVLTSRPVWIPDSTGAPRHNYSWYVFSHKHQEPATLHYHMR
jgi:hypothetical protein